MYGELFHLANLLGAPAGVAESQEDTLQSIIE